MRAYLKRLKTLFMDTQATEDPRQTVAEDGADRPFDGVHLTLDYPVMPRCRPAETSPGGQAISRMIADGNKRYRQHIRAIGQQRDRLAAIPLRSDDAHAAAWINDMFPGLDAAFLYTLIARQKPDRYIEIGSGTSTKFARQAIRDHRLSRRCRPTFLPKCHRRTSSSSMAATARFRTAMSRSFSPSCSAPCLPAATMASMTYSYPMTIRMPGPNAFTASNISWPPIFWAELQATRLSFQPGIFARKKRVGPKSRSFSTGMKPARSNATVAHSGCGVHRLQL